MKFRFMREHQESHSVELMARILGVSRSGYYAWLGRKPSDREQENDALVVRSNRWSTTRTAARE